MGVTRTASTQQVADGVPAAPFDRDDMIDFYALCIVAKIARLPQHTPDLFDSHNKHTIANLAGATATLVKLQGFRIGDLPLAHVCLNPIGVGLSPIATAFTHAVKIGGTIFTAAQTHPLAVFDTPVTRSSLIACFAQRGDAVFACWFFVELFKRLWLTALATLLHMGHLSVVRPPAA